MPVFSESAGQGELGSLHIKNEAVALENKGTCISPPREEGAGTPFPQAVLFIMLPCKYWRRTRTLESIQQTVGILTLTDPSGWWSEIYPSDEDCLDFI